MWQLLQWFVVSHLSSTKKTLPPYLWWLHSGQLVSERHFVSFVRAFTQNAAKRYQCIVYFRVQSRRHDLDRGVCIADYVMEDRETTWLPTKRGFPWTGVTVFAMFTTSAVMDWRKQFDKLSEMSYILCRCWFGLVSLLEVKFDYTSRNAVHRIQNSMFLSRWRVKETCLSARQCTRTCG